MSDIDADKVYDYHTAYEIKPSKMKMNVPLDMKGNAIKNSPSIKPQIFALPGKFDSSIDDKYVRFGGTSVIIAPVKCRMTKCFFHSASSMTDNLFLYVESQNSQNQHTQFYSYAGNSKNIMFLTHNKLSILEI